mmetsp:Transcript_47068/g.125163  ORF Transcript_47068/g.125163 Transcript_47068/m.125163 type:complete len:112 (-) Transcript_47068:15-350(-)
MYTPQYSFQRSASARRGTLQRTSPSSAGDDAKQHLPPMPTAFGVVFGSTSRGAPPSDYAPFQPCPPTPSFGGPRHYHGAPVSPPGPLNDVPPALGCGVRFQCGRLITIKLL